MTDTPDLSPAALEALADRLTGANTRAAEISCTAGCNTLPVCACVTIDDLRDGLSDAAAALRALSAEVIRLRAECFALAAGACGGHYGDDHGHSRCSLVDVQRTRADEAETRAEALAAEVIRLRQENDRLSQRVENLREALGDMLDDCEPDRPGAPRLSIREAARAALEDDA